MLKRLQLAAVAAGILAVALPSFAAPENSGQGQAVVTVLSKGSPEADLRIQPQDLQVKINGKLSSVTNWTPLRGESGPLELVLLIDSSARSSLGTQNGDIRDFLKQLPAGSKAGIAYMQNGRAAFAAPLSSDPDAVLKDLHLPNGGPGQSGSPYFCLSDLAKNWPSKNTSARREVVMITDGIDNYNPRFDPNDPYVAAAIHDAVRAGLVVYSIYWTNTGFADRIPALSNGGQSLLLQVADATGGVSYWQGSGNPVSFAPFFKDLRLRFDNQYRLAFTSELKGNSEVKGMGLKIGGPASKVTSPQQVFVTPAGE
jgi:hypothetical protein